MEIRAVAGDPFPLRPSIRVAGTASGGKPTYCALPRRLPRLHLAVMEPDISGLWHGVLDTGSVKVKLRFALEPTNNGGTIVLSTRARGDVRLPLRRDGHRVGFEAPEFDIALNLVLRSPPPRLEGLCRHADAAYPVVFEPGLVPRNQRAPRPQTPCEPLPYEARKVSFEAQDGSRLVGTLTTPAGEPPHAAVALATWFGPADRDQTTAGHRPFAIWADALTRRGLATLRYDKRGVGESRGDYHQATTADFAADLARAVAFLRDQPEVVDADRIGLLGHSEGGHICADVAVADPRIAFCVMITPSGVAEEELFESEMFRAAIAVGGVPIHPERRIRLARALAQAGRYAASCEDAVIRTRALLVREAQEHGFPIAHIEQRAALAGSPWRRHWWRYDYTASLRSLQCPLLVLLAGADLQTPPRYHAPALRSAMIGNPRAEVVQIEGLNHFLQTARTGAPSEYADIEETLAPQAIETVCDWACRTIAPGTRSVTMRTAR